MATASKKMTNRERRSLKNTSFQQAQTEAKVSSDLIWALINKNNSFLVKSKGNIFSKEPGNLLNKHSKKYSGLIGKVNLYFFLIWIVNQ